MRQGFSALLAVLLACQLCVLVLGQGPAAAPVAAVLGVEKRLVAGESDVLKVERAEVGEPAPPPLPELTVLPTIPVTIAASPVRPPVRGIYSTAYSAGSAKKFAQLLAFIRQTEVNAIVIDVKDDSGTISYPSAIPLAKAIGSGRAKFPAEKVLATLKQENIYPIARIVTFQDPYLAAKRNDLAVRSKAGGLWRDRRGQLWVDPNNREVWRYVVDIAKEAAGKGFREIQFDYVRFTSDGKLSDCIYPYTNGRSRADVIRDFLVYARQELKPLGVDVSADVFGLTCSNRGDLGIGQQIERIAAAVDIISPMVYPSHYYPGTYGLADPDLKPYETITASLQAALPRINGLGVRLRPWLQDFSLKHKYGRDQLMAQIKAVYDAGLTEWIFWNPSNVYNLAKYNPQ